MEEGGREGEGEGGERFQRPELFRFSKLSSLETVMTQLENAKCVRLIFRSPLIAGKPVIITLPIHGHSRAFVTSR